MSLLYVKGYTGSTHLNRQKQLLIGITQEVRSCGVLPTVTEDVFESMPIGLIQTIELLEIEMLQ